MHKPDQSILKIFQNIKTYFDYGMRQKINLANIRPSKKIADE